MTYQATIISPVCNQPFLFNRRKNFPRPQKKNWEWNLGTTTTRTTWTREVRSTLLPLEGRHLYPYALVGQALQQKTTDQRRHCGQLQDIQGMEGGQECLWDTSRKVQSVTDHYGAEAKSCERFCVVLHYMLRSHRGDQRDHPLQQTTYNHHRMTKGSRNRMKMSEIHRERPNINETY